MKNGNAIVGNFSERRGNLEKGTLGCPMFIEEWPWKIHLCLILWLSISKGKPWLCYYQIASQVLILYFWAMPSVELQEQLQSLCFCSAQTIPFKLPHFLIPCSFPGHFWSTEMFWDSPHWAVWNPGITKFYHVKHFYQTIALLLIGYLGFLLNFEEIFLFYRHTEITWENERKSFNVLSQICICV